LKAAPRFEEVHNNEAMMPSFMEMVATFQHGVQNGVEECCPCGNAPAPAPAPAPTPAPPAPADNLPRGN